MKEKRIMTLHPERKKGVNILEEKYNVLKDFILKTLMQEKELSFAELSLKANEELGPHFKGSVNWYLVSVKLDLEARGIIERIPKTSPHKIRIKKEEHLKTKNQ